MPLPSDFSERVYAGVLGKIIGVYLGRPFEQWSHQRIVAELGEITGYVHEKLKVPLIVSDDDITGTFTFVRALADNDFDPALTARQIGEAWLNYIIENKTILWWGGLGISTEHTAYLRLRHGIESPNSGSIATNGTTVAEQIGSQIFIDGWGMVAPGNPKLAAELAARAASVSHDGEAIYGAQVIAVMESQAFVESNLDRLLDAALTLIPSDCQIARLIRDLRDCRKRKPDWHDGLALIHEKYSYQHYPGFCHIIPNHAVVLLGLLWGEDDFGRALMITNTAGYDTDCNSGNVGCLLGIKNGLAGIDAGPTDWRGPVADRMLLPTADGGRCISDAVREADALIEAGSRLAGLSYQQPKEGARFHFELRGSVQGFVSEDAKHLRLENVAGHSRRGSRSLVLRFALLDKDHPARAATRTFITADQLKIGSYSILASPTIYPGQILRAGLQGDAGNDESVEVRLFLRHLDAKDQLQLVAGPHLLLAAEKSGELEWLIPQLDGQPIGEIGIELAGESRSAGAIYLDFLTWHGAPNVVLKKPEAGGTMWRNAWVDATHSKPEWLSDRLIQNEGRGLLMQGTREWTDYAVTAEITLHVSKAAGVAARVQGLRRHYALLLCADGNARLIKMLNRETILAEMRFDRRLEQKYSLGLEVRGTSIRAMIDGRVIFKVEDVDHPLLAGGIGIVCEEGNIQCGAVAIAPV